MNTGMKLDHSRSAAHAGFGLTVVEPPDSPCRDVGLAGYERRTHRGEMSDSRGWGSDSRASPTFGHAVCGVSARGQGRYDQRPTVSAAVAAVQASARTWFHAVQRRRKSAQIAAPWSVRGLAASSRLFIGTFTTMVSPMLPTRYSSPPITIH